MTKSPEQAIRDAERIGGFLKDEVVADALSRMERRFYEEFLDADSSEKRVTAWAKAKMLREFEREMKIVLDAGELSVLAIAKKAKTSAPPHSGS